MAINNFRFNLDIEKEDYIPKLKVKQYDTTIFYVNLLKNNGQFSVTNETIKMFVKKQDGNIVYQEDGITLDGSTIKINVNNQAFTCSGLTYAELEFKSSDGQVTSSTFVYEVKEKVGSDKAIESVTDIATLDKLKKYMEDAKKELEKFKNDLSKIEDLVANKDKLEGQNKEAKENIGELEKILEDANNITSDEGKFITGNNVVSESTNGYIQDLKICGRSLVNICNNDLINSNKGLYYNALNLGLLPLNIPLSLKIFTGNLDNKYLSWAIYGVKSDSSVVPIYPYTYNFDKAILTIPPGYSSYRLYLRNHDGNDYIDFDRNQIKINLILGDENVGVYFEGLSSSVNSNGIEVSTRKEDGNLLDLNNIDSVRGEKTWTIQGDKVYVNGITKDYETSIYYFIKIEKNKKYTVSVKDLNCGVLIYNGTVTGHDQSLHRGSITSNYRKITFTSTSDYITIRISSEIYKGDLFADGIMVNLGDLKQYKPIKKDKKTILFKDVDGNWKPVTELCGCWENGNFLWGDTVELHSDGKYYLHIRTKTAKGTDLIGLVKEQNFPNRDGYYGFLPNKEGIKLAIPDKLKPYIVCDKLKSVGIDIIAGSQYSDVDCISYDTRYKCVRLSVPKGTDINTYLSEKNITFILPIDEKIYECLDISTRAFRNKTMLSIDSGAIDPGIFYYIPTGFLSADNSISEKVETLDKYSEKNTRDINDLISNIESNYFNINRGILTDFNNGTKEGKYYLHSSSLIPNSPPTFTVGLYGIVEVLYKNENELFQFVTLHSGESWLRFRNGHGSWDKWNKLVTQNDFPSNIDSQGTGYQYLPNGMLIQWGTTTVTFDSVKGSAIIRYPVTYKEYCKCTGNLESNDYGAYSETNAVVGGQTLSQGFCEVRDINGSSRAGKTARVTWIVIGR
ncbi:BppU family phage baseplate upper protein [Paraclostridium bifermentans]|uniref:BppU family phage baseplate upper protein n=1 Tax=Paraclostridium bifermentans TaxID=1490 RepID=UPI0022E57574|nr:BppU family phage baseplate upper protein [Paraclostridium bifermentans]